ncbi:MAG: acetate/propionate family kinase [Rhodopseudomonas sp.]|uniref:acetate/propionate family kinase n=1 Tax=Rhodopseudomonas sp. TaxID=1078 RepID=UPI0017BE3B86|nr:acetate/propionate family kinase [Rhodopseudomonas sp.]NVN85447.1 acetate/propionate family kinase [Rhodopseudomonas sp.]
MPMVLTLNAGSSSVKFALFDAALDDGPAMATGQIDGLASHAIFTARAAATEKECFELSPAGRADHVRAVNAILEWIESRLAGRSVVAIGHRIVHGGPRHATPLPIDDNLIEELRALTPLAPLHQPHNLQGVVAARAEFPHVPQVACFDTAFHRGHPFVTDAFAIPRHFYHEGVRRYGFHGLSYEYIAGCLRRIAPVEAAGKVIIAHLGNGASLCAVRDGRSIASSMGFTALDGLPMGTRCGQIDPGVLLYLMAEKGMDVHALTDLLYNQSGLKGLSGLSSDMRDLQASDSREARETIDHFILRTCRKIGSLVAALEGFDAIVFTGGIGENSAAVRKGVLDRLRWLGLEPDDEANERGDTVISSPACRARAFVIKTDEERMIARHTLEVTGLAGRSRAA